MTEPSHNIIKDLGDGLILRRATLQDAEALAAFNAMIHSDAGPDKPDERLFAWTHDLAVKPHPTYQVGDFTIVEDTRAGKIVSSLNLIPQTWSYGGVRFGVGRPELVGTHPEYRNRGLVRAQFEVIHQWSAERGESVQAITGIPYYYRQFGYEMGLALGGGRAGFSSHIPRLKEDEQEPYRIRPALEADLPFIAGLYDAGCKRSLVACVWDAALWRYELTGKSEKNVNRLELRLIETPQGEPVGFLAHPFFTWGDMMSVQAYELKPGVSWFEVTPSVIRYIEAVYEKYQPEQGEKKPFGAFGFWLGEEHPVYHTIPDRLPRHRRPYAWYVRVPDLPAFLQLIAPVLEQRLAASPILGYTGELKLSFYRDGVRLVFEQGKLALAERWKPTPFGHSGDAGFPDLTFLSLLFGYRSLETLRSFLADCWVGGDATAVLLDTLFPKQPSIVWPVA
jgi:hypothetical protein